MSSPKSTSDRNPTMNSGVRADGQAADGRAADLPGPAPTPPVDGSSRANGGEATAPPRTGNPVAAERVAEMFDDIAPVYDRMNTLMTLGSDRRWRQRAVDATGLRLGESVIDVASGTGKLSVALAERVGPFGRVVGIDLSPAMVAYAQRAYPDLVQLQFQVGDALELPVSDGEFDGATIAFGLRNLVDFEAGLRELRRVVRPGGRIVCLELSMPRPRIWGTVYHGLFRRSAPLLGSIVRRRSAYAYLPDTLSGFPPPDQLAATMRRVGLTEVGFRRLALGAVAIHRGRVPTS